MASRLPAGVAILISGASPALSPSCESVRAVMDQFKDIYHDKEADEISLEKKNLALREEVLRDSSIFKHPCQSKSWIWKCFYWALRSAYLLALWTPSALLYIVSKVTDNAALRELWLDLTVWTIETSGCIFIKFAQWCSMRPDMFAMEVIEKLKVLQQVSVTHSMAHTRHEIRASFGRELEEIFSEFNPVPIASGSIAQVHHARLRSTGQEVAVKVRHPSVIEQSFVDLNIISSFVLAGKLTSLPFDRAGLISHLHRQVDLSIEAQNLRLFRANFAREMESGLLIFPEAVRGLASASVLVETWCEGKEVTNLFCRAWTREGIDKKAIGTIDQADRKRNSLIARTLFDAYMKMFLRDNCIHGDLHGGNVLYHGQNGQSGSTPGVERLSIIDVGLITSLPADVQTGFASFFVAIMKGDADGLVDQILLFNTNDDAVNSPEIERVFRQTVREVVDKEICVESNRAPNGDPIHAGNIVGAVMRIMQEHEVRIDKDFASGLWSMTVAEGLIKQLDPCFDIVGESRPYFTRYAGSGLLREFTTRKLVAGTVDSYLQSLMASVREHFPKLGSWRDDAEADMKNSEFPVLINDA